MTTYEDMQKAYDKGYAEAIDEYKIKLLNIKAFDKTEVNALIEFKRKVIDIAEQLKEQNNVR